MKKFMKLNLALAVSIAIASVAPVNAQEQGASLEEIVVLGQKLSNAKAIDAKRESFRVFDGVLADDVGSLPDDNAGEALQRIAGVSIVRDQNEARFVSVRALNENFNFVVVDGGVVATPDRGKPS